VVARARDAAHVQAVAVVGAAAPVPSFGGGPGWQQQRDAAVQGGGGEPQPKRPCKCRADDNHDDNLFPLWPGEFLCEACVLPLCNKDGKLGNVFEYFTRLYRSSCSHASGARVHHLARVLDERADEALRLELAAGGASAPLMRMRSTRMDGEIILYLGTSASSFSYVAFSNNTWLLSLSLYGVVAVAGEHDRGGREEAWAVAHARAMRGSHAWRAAGARCTAAPAPAPLHVHAPAASLHPSVDRLLACVARSLCCSPPLPHGQTQRPLGFAHASVVQPVLHQSCSMLPPRVHASWLRGGRTWRATMPAAARAVPPPPPALRPLRLASQHRTHFALPLLHFFLFPLEELDAARALASFVFCSCARTIAARGQHTLSDLDQVHALWRHDGEARAVVAAAALMHSCSTKHGRVHAGC
jgi:hypothetical protein